MGRRGSTTAPPCDGKSDGTCGTLTVGRVYSGRMPFNQWLRVARPVIGVVTAT
jgi:hypothetical protein